MFTAINSLGQKICLMSYDYNEIKGFKDLKWFCPACHARLILKNGIIKQPHFAHTTLETCQAYSENESELHHDLKCQLAKWFQQQNYNCQIEYYLIELKQIPDLLINHHLAIEIQCSPLSIQRFNTRTKNYLDHGYQVIWLLGEKMQIKSRLTSLQLAMCAFSINSGVFLWQINQKQLELIEMIHVDLERSISYQKKTFAFFQGNIINHLRLPYRIHSNSLSGNVDWTMTSLIVRKGLYYANQQWMCLHPFAIKRG
ncbi:MULTISPECIES: competence protein CoiA family protein [unclassified Enterococcus]|uniref:competence protein CoiA n=1 Tax=unclassified Enterococcus TaxID=2608891 RepID=UPI0015582235|nr:MULTISPECIES: competence protein CoiA family protein [unclassified Enterococcus]MBS7577227.1 competence protein CoiA [Enterococcus sp. MMGLQ5-2]MBS7584680.1 competence protein CoiA [Enterococcus sp. MMGLQ5-1]NPD12535.1 competence protein CoiA [Enterococcus sp. MMGLQ5-1]NPD37061.1 competence protein CoiA [Enterococcus sp. MMGLQ5-2]